MKYFGILFINNKGMIISNKSFAYVADRVLNNVFVLYNQNFVSRFTF